MGQWLRAAASSPDGRRCALRYAGGVTAVQIGWVLRLGLDGGAGMVAFVVLASLELAVPVWAEAVDAPRGIPVRELVKTEAACPGSAAGMLDTAKSQSLSTLKEKARDRRLRAVDPEELQRSAARRPDVPPLAHAARDGGLRW